MTMKPLDIFCASIRRVDKLRAMIESVAKTNYPAHICVAAGDLETVKLCEQYPNLVDCVYNTQANARIGCTAPLNHVYKSLVKHDALFCTDDCIFAHDALHIAMTTLYERFPQGDGVVGLAQENIPDGYPLAFPLFGRAFLDRFAHFGDIFFPGYFHLYNDAEIGLTIACMGNWVFEPRAKLRHLHPECGGGEIDFTHHHAQTHKSRDQHVWANRRSLGILWGIDEDPEDVAPRSLEPLQGTHA